MQLANQSGDPDQKMSPSIYTALVDSLFQDPGPMFAGVLCAAVAAMMTAVKTGNAWLWPCVVVLVVTGALRALDSRQYLQRKEALTAHDAVRWELRYQVGAMFYAAALGLWCIVAVLSSNDAAAHLICISVTLCYIAAGGGRTYGRPWIFHVQMLLACGPLTLALALYGSPYYFGMAVLNVLFFFSLKHISTNLQKIFVRALIAREREAALAGQFDTALNNMPHGLCMFAADGRLAVMNHRFSAMMNLSDDLMHRGASAADIVAACVSAGTLSSASAKMIVSEIEDSQARDITTTDPDAASARSFSWTFQPMAGGGTVVLVEDITERKIAEARISHLARYDELTALPNRLNFRDEIERLLAVSNSTERLSALLFIDLDQFKQVNDTLGHPCGDQLLCAVADRLRAMLRPEDFVARFGGDEFVVFQQNIKSAEEAATLARRIVEHLSERYQVGNHLVEIGASVGIAMTSCGYQRRYAVEERRHGAVSRQGGRPRHFLLLPRRDGSNRRVAPYSGAGLAQGAGQQGIRAVLSAARQSQVGADRTCEALLRWNHPLRGTVSPVDIIPVAEDMGLIVDLGRWILRKACMECMKWPEGVSVAVNFSPQQFHQRDVLSEVRYALEVSGLPAHRLEIEITEVLAVAQHSIDA